MIRAQKTEKSKFKVASQQGQFLGVTNDGVKVFRTRFASKRFTEDELRRAVTKVLAKSA
jgi:hypothetical protein